MCVCSVCLCSNSQSCCYRLDEMKSEQAKLQSQLKEFEKKQADYEEVRLDHHSSVSPVLGKLLFKVTSYILLATELFSYSYILPIK